MAESGSSVSKRRPCPKCKSRKWTYLMGTTTGTVAGCSECPRGKPYVTLDYVKGEVRYGE